MNSHWVKTISRDELKHKRQAVFRHDGKQIALFDTAKGIFACNNRCPHEGYPLREGTLDDGCILTCNWHNWKFDLSSGDNLYGGDRLRVYPLELRGDEIWIDLADPPLEQRRAEIMANLRSAFDDHDYTRIARELGRLRLTGSDPTAAVAQAIVWSFDRLEFGWTHAYAGAADWLTLYDEHPDPELQLICLLEAIGHIAYDVLRERDYPFPEQRQPYDEDNFVQAIEAEDQETAIAMMRGAGDADLGFADLERGLSRAALLHYNDFGHSLIYVTKAGRLIRRLGETVQEPLLLSLVRSIVFATREDQIPEFRAYTQALEAWDAGATEPRGDAYRGLGVDKALKLTVASAGAPPESAYHALLGANAANLLAFDISYQNRSDRPISDNVGWLDFTHGITFANAVRSQCGKFPELWPAGLLQLACFCGRNAPYTDANLDTAPWRVDDSQTFVREAVETLFDHGQGEYIVSVHLLKTLLAAREEVRRQPELAELILTAVNRFLHSPLKRRHARRTVRQAVTFVARDG